MILLTYITHNSGYFDALKVSSKNKEFHLKILGWGENWEGFIQRTKAILEYLKTVDKNEIICCVDGFDVIMLGTYNEVLNKFKAFNTDKVIFSTSRDNYFLNIIYGKVNPNDAEKEYNRLCAGCFIGYAHKIIELFENICEITKLKNEDDDQYYLTKCYGVCSGCIVLDSENKLFYAIESQNGMLEYAKLCLGKEPIMNESNSYYKFENNRLVLKNNNKPPIIQGNGNVNMDSLCKKLNLPLKIKENRNFFDYSTKKFINKIIYYLIGNLIVFAHFVFNIFMIFMPYLTNNIYILITIIALNICILTQWYLLGNCFLNKIESVFLGREKNISSDGLEKSSFVYYFEKVIGEKNTHLFFSLIPLINSIYCYVKIMHLLRYNNNIRIRFFDRNGRFI